MLPIVAIIGRTNVGKSTLFNRITRSRNALVANEPGVTRDRLFGKAEHLDRPFILVDTGGFEDPKGEFVLERMLEQTELGIEEADRIILVVDGRAGLLPADREVAQRLRKSQKPVFIAVNKVDEPRFAEEQMADFYQLGSDQIHPVSSEHNRGVEDLLDEVTKGFPEVIEEIPDEQSFEEEAEAATEIESLAPARPLRVAIVGRPNVGKSSLVNRLLGYERVVVHDEAGTTRDSIDTDLTWHGKQLVLVDTAGVRRKSRVVDRIEKFSAIKAFRSIEECDVAVLVLDASVGVHEQDAKIAGMIVEEGRGLVVVFNKWDLPEGREDRIKELQDELAVQMKFLPHPPVLFVSAKSGQRTGKILELVTQVGDECSKRIPTSLFNRMILAAYERHKPPMWANHPIKFFFGAQISVRPPKFAITANWPEGVHFSYERYMLNVIRENYGFAGVPIRLAFRAKPGRHKGKGKRKKK